MDDERMKLLQEDKKFVDNKTVTVRPQEGLPEKARIVPKDVLPGYMIKLTAGYEYRTYWFEVCRVNSQGILFVHFSRFDFNSRVRCSKPCARCS